METTGLTAPAAAAASTRATSSPVVRSGGVKITTTESTRSSSNTHRSAAANSSADASGPSVVQSSVTTSSPCVAAASIASSVSASELLTIAIVRPFGSGWCASSCATSNISPVVSTLIRPLCRNSASTAVGGRSLSRTAWPSGTPWVLRPDFSATTGLRRASRRATRANLRGLPIDSMYSSTSSVASSEYQYCIRSLPETSARLPADTKVDSPNPRPITSARMVTPSAPDWQKNPTRPAVGISGDRLAFSEIRGSALITPSAFGPITRSPYERARPASRRCRIRPSSPSSANPLDTTTSPCTPFAAQSSTTSSTASAGTATTARSTRPSMPVTRSYAGTPSIGLLSPSEFTAYTEPVKPLSFRFRSNALPIVPSRRLAPITATLDGLSSRAIDCASERCSRACITPYDVSVGRMSNATITRPSSNSRATW